MYNIDDNEDFMIMNSTSFRYYAMQEKIKFLEGKLKNITNGFCEDLTFNTYTGLKCGVVPLFLIDDKFNLKRFLNYLYKNNPPKELVYIVGVGFLNGIDVDLKPMEVFQTTPFVKENMEIKLMYNEYMYAEYGDIQLIIDTFYDDFEKWINKVFDDINLFVQQNQIPFSDEYILNKYKQQKQTLNSVDLQF